MSDNVMKAVLLLIAIAYIVLIGSIVFFFPQVMALALAAYFWDKSKKKKEKNLA